MPKVRIPEKKRWDDHIGYIAILKQIMVGWIIVGDEIYSQLCGDYSINHYENMYQTTSIKMELLCCSNLYQGDICLTPATCRYNTFQLPPRNP